MFGLFKRKKKRVEIPRDPPAGLYQGVWEKKRQPSPGAQSFAWESLGLAPFTPIGPSIHVREGIRPMAGVMQPAVGQAVWLDGVPTTAGQVYGQGLYDESSGGFVRSGMPIINDPFPARHDPIGGKIQ